MHVCMLMECFNREGKMDAAGKRKDVKHIQRMEKIRPIIEAWAWPPLSLLTVTADDMAASCGCDANLWELWFIFQNVEARTLEWSRTPE